jgi:SAM-dependent methyltransferase
VAAAADKAEGSDAVELPRAERLAALRDARKRKAPADDGTRRIRVTHDARGDEQLELCGAPAEGASSVVMMAWERPYMEALVDALAITSTDSVLEVGYGLGFSCAAIQRRRPRRHVVVECDATVRARIPDGVEVVSDYVPARWDRTPPQRGAASHGVEVAATTWQAYIDSVSFYDDAERFDAVFFDDFPIVATPSRGSRWRTFLQAVRPLLRPGCRVVGYCCDAERLRAALPIGYSLVSVAPFALTPPADCPYVSEAAGDRCVVAVIKHIIL